MVSDGDTIEAQLDDEDRFEAAVIEAEGGEGKADHRVVVTELLEEGEYSVQKGDEIGISEDDMF